MMEPQVCPRCEESYIPNNHDPGAYPGAVSRTDNETYICSLCGEDEAVGNIGIKPISDTGTGFDPMGNLVPQEEWPTKVTEFSLRMARQSDFVRAQQLLALEARKEE